MKKNRKRKSALSGQKKRKRNQWSAPKAMLMALLMGAILYGGFVAVKAYESAADAFSRLWQRTFPSQLVSKPVAVKYFYEPKEARRSFQALENNMTELVNNMISKSVSRGQIADQAFLRRISGQIWSSNPWLESVEVTTSQNDVLNIRLRARSAALKIIGKKTRLMSGDGKIFGELGTPPTNLTPGQDMSDLPQVYLQGTLERQFNQASYNGNSLKVPDRLERALAAALQLRQHLSSAGFMPQSFRIETFRGLEVDLPEGGVAVFGWPPFERKVSRLKFILSSYRGRPEKAAKIELDYHDKAFIEKM